MKFIDKSAIPAALLAACILGLVSGPYNYIIAGALFSFPLAFSLLILPPFLAGSAYLLWSFLRSNHHSTQLWSFILEWISWLAIVNFTVLISGFTLMTESERFGAFCVIFLAASALCLPLTLLRESALQKRLQTLPRRWLVSLFLIAIVLSAYFGFIHLTTPAKFI